MVLSHVTERCCPAGKGVLDATIIPVLFAGIQRGEHAGAVEGGAPFESDTWSTLIPCSDF
ncbi:MAG TPA: hypothetical protein PKJ41_07430 [Bryobacteraceae bacterium]|nr:hypothetical protein [Bryobacteraceae bacterium]